MRTPSRSRHRRGATSVEFAFAASILFTLTLACVEMSRMNMIRNMSEDAAYEASRTLIVPGSQTSDATSRAIAMLRIAGIKKATINVSPAIITSQTPSVTVGVSVPLDTNCWLPPMFLGGRTVSSTCTLHRSWVKNDDTSITPSGSTTSTTMSDETSPAL